MKYILLFSLLLSQLDCLAQLWTQKADFGGVGRHRSFGISIGNKGYIGTGHVNGTGTNISHKDWWQYDPSSNSWSQKADYPIGNYGVVGWGTATRGYAGGGASLTNEMYEYNPVTNIWTQIANAPFSIGEKQAFSVQGKGYVFGNNELAEYSPSTGAWTVKANCPITPSTWACAFGTSTSGFVKSGTSFYEYKPANDAWVSRAGFPGLATNGGTAFSINQRGYVVCGYISGLSNVTDEVWEFNPATNVWSQVNYFPGTNRRFPVGFAIGDIGYFGSGTNGINFNDFWQFYYPILNTENLNLQSADVDVYPIPAEEKVWINIKNKSEGYGSNYRIKVYDLKGTKIREKRLNSNQIEIDREGLSSGIYHFIIEDSNGEMFSGKLIFK